MKNFKIKSYCKINLSLKIINKLKNGYHNISSLITFSDLHDVISISKIEKTKDKITFSGKFCNDINQKSNTITAVLKILREKKLIKNQSFKINVKKNIQARYIWNSILKLDEVEQKLKDEVSKKLIYGITNKL